MENPRRQDTIPNRLNYSEATIQEYYKRCEDTPGEYIDSYNNLLVAEMQTRSKAIKKARNQKLKEF